MMQLIRHTIEYIKNQKSLGRGIIYTNRENITEIIRVTPSYEQADRAKVIRRNQDKPLRHAYFREYRKLQELCLMILKQRKDTVLDIKSKNIAFSLMLLGFGKNMFIPCCQKISYIHAIKKRKEGVSVFLVGNEGISRFL